MKKTKEVFAELEAISMSSPQSNEQRARRLKNRKRLSDLGTVSS